MECVLGVRRGQGRARRLQLSGFLLPDDARQVSTRAFPLFLEQRGWLDSAAEIERGAIGNGRNFSRLRFPPEWLVALLHEMAGMAISWRSS